MERPPSLFLKKFSQFGRLSRFYRLNKRSSLFARRPFAAFSGSAPLQSARPLQSFASRLAVRARRGDFSVLPPLAFFFSSKKRAERCNRSERKNLVEISFDFIFLPFGRFKQSEKKKRSKTNRRARSKLRRTQERRSRKRAPYRRFAFPVAPVRRNRSVSTAIGPIDAARSSRRSDSRRCFSRFAVIVLSLLIYADPNDATSPSPPMF